MMVRVPRTIRRRSGTRLRLTLLAPETVEARRDEREQGLVLPRLLERFPTCWTEQEALFVRRPSPPTRISLVKRIAFTLSEHGFIHRICADQQVEVYVVRPSMP